MHPAKSIIFFTSLSGVGYGLAATLGLGLLPSGPVVGLLGYGLALALIVGGLLSSTAHLGHPERAWRAFSQWRTSWLSREGVLSIVAFVPIGLAAVSSIFLDQPWSVMGFVAAALCLATVISTSMIYASLRAVATWHTPLTPIAFVAFAAAGGLTAASSIAVVSGNGTGTLFTMAAAALVIAWLVKVAWWKRAAHASSGATMQSATGIAGLGAVRQLEQPHTSENYLTQEMGFRIARKHATRLRMVAMTLGGGVPLVCLLLAALTPQSPVGALLAIAALVTHVFGVLTERWLFFAEARHTVMLYYGAAA